MRNSLILLVLSFACIQSNAASAQSSTIEIRLKSPVPVQADLIRVADIADVVGGDAALRHVINGLDVDLLESNQYSTTIDPRAVRIRCLLAGVKASKIRVSGPPMCLAYRGVSRRAVSLVRPEQKDPESIVVEAIQNSMARIWKVDSTKLDVWLTKPITEFQMDTPAFDRSMVRVYPPGDPKPGQMTLTVMIRQANGSPIRALVTAHVSLTAPNTDEASPLIRQASLSTVGSNRAATPTKREIVIRPNDTVQLTAVRGPLRVAISDAKALQSGRKGDTIRLRNPASGQIVRGRVVSRSQVVIEL